MAQFTVTLPMGAIHVDKGVTYTSNNVTAAADYAVCLMGVKITDESGQPTRLRGLRMTIVNTELVAVTPLPNVPYLWVEGVQLKFKAGYTYTFLDTGMIGFGVGVAV